jgi:hypothetical protein
LARHPRELDRDSLVRVANDGAFRATHAHALPDRGTRVDLDSRAAQGKVEDSALELLAATKQHDPRALATLSTFGAAPLVAQFGGGPPVGSVGL